MEKKNKVLILLLVILFLVGAAVYFSDFFKVMLGVTGNAVKVVG
ncbi:Uncharacterised protein [uncultured archaeon]|nr:Uncharacterised protein [uncultured archaeon]